MRTGLKRKHVAVPANQDDSLEVGTPSLLQVLKQTVWQSRAHDPNAWEVCFCLLIAALDPSLRMHEVSEALPCEANSLDKIGFMNTMANLGYASQSMRVRLRDIDTAFFPCLFIPDAAPESPAFIPKKGRIFNAVQKSWRRISPSSCMSGEILIFRKIDESFAETSIFMRKGTGYSWFRALLNRLSGTIAYVLMAGLALNIIALSTPIFIMIVYDRIISAHAPEILPMLAIGMAIAITAEWILRSIRARSLSWIGGRIDNIVSNWMFAHLTHLSSMYVERASVPSQIARLKTFESIRDFFGGSMFLTVLELPFMIFSLIVIGLIAGKLVLIPLVATCVFTGLFYVTWKYSRIAIRHAAKTVSARQQFSLDTFEKAEAIRANGLVEVWQEKFRDLSGRESMAQLRLAWIGSMAENIASGLTILSAAAIIGFGVHNVWAGTLTTGAMVGTMILVWRVLGPLYGLCSMVPRLEQIRNSVQQVNTLMDIPSEEHGSEGLSRPVRLKGQVSFVNAGLRYTQNQDPVFSNLSFDAKPGDIVAITGENGSGKTSMLKLIKSLYYVQAGSIRIDGFDIRQINPHDIRRNIAYIPQTPDFFHGSVLENLRFANPLATEGEIRQALGQAQVLEEIMALPCGLNTIIGGRQGIRLSSTLSLRLSMVRAYLQNAPIMLIDEMPNSLMSKGAGRILHDTITRHRGEQTIFIVTYREDFLQIADTVICLRRGATPMAGPGKMTIEKLKNNLW